MRSKKRCKKLELNKTTILDLSNGKMKAVIGGDPYTDNDHTCPITGCQTECQFITQCWSMPCC